MKQPLLITLLFLLSLNLNAEVKPLWVTIGADVIENKGLTDLFLDVRMNKTVSDAATVLIDEKRVAELSERMHDLYNRCGGFIAHDDFQSAIEYQGQGELEPLLVPYSIDQHSTVINLINQVSESELAGTIETLSNYKNRYYTSTTGVESAKWIYNKWKTLLASRNDSQVETVAHSFGPQPSVVATIIGSTYPDEIVVIGGHLDSTAGYFGAEKAKAPGADDNASGIAVVTETIRLLVQNGYKPSRTIKFMGYAAEEVGLRGSKAIADDFKKRKLNVIGAIQFDMTNFKGSDWDIVMMSDYTSENQNKFVGSLIDEYVKIPWGFDRCGYGCSDHASWTGAGFNASVPFESKKNDMNPNIHSSKDLLSVSGNAEHSVNFGKLAVAYAIELAK